MPETSIDEFIERARAVTVSAAAVLCGYAVSAREWTGPCPRCGGVDRFSINARKGAFNCRACGGGRDGIGLMAHVRDFDLQSRAGFIEACAAALGEPVPDGAERLTGAQREASAARLARLHADNARKSEEDARRQEDFRRREIKRARAIYCDAAEAGDCVVEYLRLRTGFAMPDAIFEHLRYAPAHPLWHGSDARGDPLVVYRGPAMIAAFVAPDGAITGCHETWIALGMPPRFRPAIVDGAGKLIPSKKMRGTKAGALIPVLGQPSATCWAIGEGIENTAAFAGAQGFPADVFYAAAGDLGNMAGPADPASNFPHPELITESGRPKRIPGPIPRADGVAMQVPDHVTQLYLLADGDSDLVFTASAMERARARHARRGLHVTVCWPPAQQDFASTLAVLWQEIDE